MAGSLHQAAPRQAGVSELVAHRLGAVVQVFRLAELRLMVSAEGWMDRAGPWRFARLPMGLACERLPFVRLSTCDDQIRDCRAYRS